MVEWFFLQRDTTSAVFIPRGNATDVGAQPGFTIEAWLQPTGGRLVMWIGWSDDESSTYGPYGYLMSDNSVYFNLVDTSHAGHPISSAAECGLARPRCSIWP